MPLPINSAMKKLDEEKRTDMLTDLLGGDDKKMDGIIRRSSFQRQLSK